MNPLGPIEKIVEVRNELEEMQRKLEHLRRELDLSASELVEFLVWKGLVRRTEK